MMEHKIYSISLHVQSSIPNIQNLVYLSKLPNVACKELVIIPIFVPFIENVMEQNPIGFPNSMYPHDGPYTPYFGYGYGGIRSVPIIWLPMFYPLTNPITLIKPILGVA
jgi:hypothetical protein